MIQAASMIARWILLCFCLLACVAQASVTVAWKIPLEWVRRHVMPGEALPKLEHPPGESTFFQPGDVMLDLKPLLDSCAGTIRLSGKKDDSPDADAAAGRWTGDWAVWNERSGMVVACGSYNDIFVAEEALSIWGRACVIPVKMEIVAADPAQSRSLQVAARSGEKASMEIEGFAADVEATCSESADTVDMLLSPSWPAAAEDSYWNLRTAVNLPAGQRTLIAAHGSGKSRWELFVTAMAEYPGGVPVRELRWIERNGLGEAWPRVEVMKDDGIGGTLPDGQVVWTHAVPLPFVEAILPVWSEEPGAPLAKVTAPEAAGDWMRGEAADLRGKIDLKGQGKLGFAGLDSRSGCIVLVGDAAGVKAAQGIFWDWMGPFCPAPPPLVVESNAEAGGWMLACPSGQKASIGLSSGEKEEKESFVIDLSPALGSDMMDLHFAMDIMPEDEAIGHVESNLQLSQGTSQEVGAYTPAGVGAERKLTLTVRKLEP